MKQIGIIALIASGASLLCVVVLGVLLIFSSSKQEEQISSLQNDVKSLLNQDAKITTTPEVISTPTVTPSPEKKQSIINFTDTVSLSSLKSLKLGTGELRNDEAFTHPTKSHLSYFATNVTGYPEHSDTTSRIYEYNSTTNTQRQLYEKVFPQTGDTSIDIMTETGMKLTVIGVVVENDRTNIYIEGSDFDYSPGPCGYPAYAFAQGEISHGYGIVILDVQNPTSLQKAILPKEEVSRLQREQESCMEEYDFFQ